MQDQTLHTASSSSNIETFIVISSAIKAKVVVLHTKQQNQIASKAAPLGAVAAGCIPAIYTGFGAAATTRKPLVDNQRHCLLVLSRIHDNWYNAYVSSVPVQLLTMYGWG